MVAGVGKPPQIPDGEFVAGLRATVQAYLAAVDQWEAAYQKYYRLPGFAARIDDDLEAEQRAYEDRRRELQGALPRARRLCLKHSLREPFSGLLRISLGQYAPQVRMDSTIGRNERNSVAKCLVELHDACQEWAPAGSEAGDRAERASGGLLRRLVSFFY
jgi:hypothetical protein